MKKLLLVLVLLLAGGCGAAEPTPTPAPTACPATPTPAAHSGILIVAMGDSLTEGLGVDTADAYPAQLERKLRAGGYDVTVVNAGVSGETSSGALSRVDWVLRQKPDIVILATGGNDGLRGVEPSVTAKEHRPDRAEDPGQRRRGRAGGHGDGAEHGHAVHQ